MAVSPAVNRLVWVKSGGLCAFPDCRMPLIERASGDDADTPIGQVAHIVAQGGSGPRADKPVPGGERDGIANLLLLCPTHHNLVDRQPQTYPVERLVGIKEEHERWILDRLSVEETNPSQPLIRETVHSSLLAVERMPPSVYIAPCDLSEYEVRQRIRFPANRAIALPYIVRERKLITFTSLTAQGNPFADAMSEPAAAERHDAHDWWRDPDLSNWYVTLLNRTLNKMTGRRGLNLDKEHKRFFFDANRADDGSALPREVSYRPLNLDTSTRNVVWQPTRKATGETRNYWIHLGVSLRFHRMNADQWVLALRPERRFTVDGWKPLVAKATGRRSTRLKSHMYNYSLLNELHFWKEYLSAGMPHIILDFGGQALVIDTQFLSVEVEWSGVPGDVKPFSNVAVEHDLFSSAAYHRALEGGIGPDAELDWGELEELIALEADHAIGDDP